MECEEDSGLLLCYEPQIHVVCLFLLKQGCGGDMMLMLRKCHHSVTLIQFCMFVSFMEFLTIIWSI